MNHFLRHVPALLLCSALSAQGIPIGPYSCVTLRSDAQSGITRVSAGAPSIPLSPVPFTAADFAAACGGQPVVEVPPYPVWCHTLTADPAAKWIGIDGAGTAASTLFCQPFQVPACGVQSASIRFSFCVDDWIGDPPNGPNPVGVFLNGQPIPGFGGVGSQVTWTSTSIAPLLVGGTNRLQVYVRDNGASISGVMYSAAICWVGCRTDEVIRLRSGNGAIGGPDSAIRMLAGSNQTPIAMTGANFALAAGGPAAAIVPPSPFWCPSLAADPQARWISTDQGYGPRSALYSHPFPVNACGILSATLSFTCGVSSWLGDPFGSPNVGLFVNQNPVPLSAVDGLGGGACNLNVTANIPPAWLNGNAMNTLHVYVRDIGHLATGVIYSATLTVRPCPPGSEVIDLRSGNGSLGGTDAAIRFLPGTSGAQPLSSTAFTPAVFAAAASGPSANIVQNFQWAPTLAPDPQAKWVSSSPIPGAVRSALFAHPFTVATCAGDIKKAQLVIHYHADDGLGDPAGGGPNPMGLYLNGVPVPGTAGDTSTWPGTNQKTIVVGNVVPFLLNGANVLYVYVRDRNNGISGVMYSARIVISPCDWSYYGDPCGTTVPNTFLVQPPTLGNPVDYRLAGESIASPRPMAALVVIGLSDQVGPGGMPLPLDLGPFGAPGCRLLTSIELSFFVITDPAGNAGVSFGLPNNPVYADLPLFFQTVTLDGVSNPLGLSATRGIAVDCRLP